MRLGIVGIGQFAPESVGLYRAHPGVEGIVLCDVLPERAARVKARYGDEVSVAGSFDELCDSDIDAIAIFTQRWLHAPMTLQALAAGKHVYSAVPMAVTIEEVEAILRAVERTGLVYMSGETSFYYPAVVFCRQKWQAGEFGDFVYAEGEYLHDMSHGFYDAYRFSGGDEWKRTASFPPMHYPTHSLSSVLSVVDSHVTSVSCLGVRDTEDDGVFRAEVSQWRNEFSNETALFSLAGGGGVRINEFRRVGVPNRQPSVRLSLFGTRGSFEQQTGSSVWGTLTGFDDVTEQLRSTKFEGMEALLAEGVSEAFGDDFRGGFAAIHDTHRLPSAFQGLPNGHQGSHQFLVDDFVTACTQRTVPPIHAWRAARYVVPGIAAHQSALQGGIRLDVPDFGPGPEVGSPL